MDGCPSDQVVADFVSRRATPVVAGDLEAHIDRCTSCRELVSMLVQATVPVSGAPGRHPLEGTQIGRFVVAERLGAGGMGAVYAAHDPALDRRVAVKVLHERAGGEWSGRLLREAQALARLAHPNVVAVHDVGEHDGQVFIAMELVEGLTLSAWLALRARPWPEVVECFVQAGRGLAAAHQAGFVHRDFKPDNVLVGDDGRARVTDFGLARLGSAPDGAPPPHALVDEITRTGTVVGTPAYMAPEQLDGRATDARADQFAFCVALAEALTGERPYRGDHVAELRAEIAAGAIGELRGAAPARIAAALRRGLAEDPAVRFPDMPALLAALTAAASPWRRRRKWVGAGAVALVAAVAAAGWRIGRTEPVAAVDPCGGAEAALAGVWDGPRRAAVHAAFTATRQPYAEDTWRTAEQVLDGWAAAWRGAHRDACGDSAVRREQSDELLDRRMSCLDQQLGEAGALTRTFAAADRTVIEHAVAAAAALPDPAVCGDREALMAPDAPPADPALRRRVEAFDGELAAANTLWMVGKVTEAVAALDHLASAAAALDHRPALARAQLRRGLAQVAVDERAAQTTLREAVRTAEVGHLDAIRADALIALVGLAARDVGQPGAELDAALALADDAAAVVARAGGDRLRLARLATNRGSLLLAAGRTEEALTAVLAAVAIEEQAQAPDRLGLAEALDNLGSAQHDLGRLAEAVAQQRRALAILEEALGPSHPNVGAALHNLGLTLQEQGALAEARACFERSGAILTAIHGPDAALVAQSLAALGDTLVYAGQPAEALPHLTRAAAVWERAEGQPSPDILDSLGRAEGALGHLDDALAIHQRALALRRETVGPDDRDVALSHLNLGHQLLAAERFAAALPHFRESLRIDEAIYGPTGAALLLDLELLGQTQVHLGRPREAIAVLERAVAIGASAPAGQPLVLATARLFLGRALWESGGDRVRARALIDEAAAALAQLGDDPQARSLADAIEQWRAAHSGKEPSSRSSHSPSPGKSSNSSPGSGWSATGPNSQSSSAPSSSP